MLCSRLASDCLEPRQAGGAGRSCFPGTQSSPVVVPSVRAQQDEPAAPALRPLRLPCCHQRLLLPSPAFSSLRNGAVSGQVLALRLTQCIPGGRPNPGCLCFPRLRVQILLEFSSCPLFIPPHPARAPGRAPACTLRPAGGVGLPLWSLKLLLERFCFQIQLPDCSFSCPECSPWSPAPPARRLPGVLLSHCHVHAHGVTIAVVTSRISTVPLVAGYL